MVEECQVVHVNTVTRKIRVERIEHNNLLSSEIPVFKGMALPRVNAFVVCMFSAGKGYLIGELE